jgi:hypothetical protein
MDVLQPRSVNSIVGVAAGQKTGHHHRRTGSKRAHPEDSDDEYTPKQESPKKQRVQHRQASPKKTKKQNIGAVLGVWAALKELPTDDVVVIDPKDDDDMGGGLQILEVDEHHATGQQAQALLEGVVKNMVKEVSVL